MSRIIPVAELAADRLSMAVVLAVAEVENVDPLELPPLGYSVDPRALDMFFAGTGSASTVTFAYDIYEIRIENGETITVRKLESDRS